MEKGFEADCAVSVGIDLARGRWEEALRAAQGFSETACQKSNRLWMLKQMGGSPNRAVDAGNRLVRVEPEAETSYLFLAAAQWRAGHQKASRETIELGKRRASKVILLKEPIQWRPLP